MRQGVTEKRLDITMWHIFYTFGPSSRRQPMSPTEPAGRGGKAMRTLTNGQKNMSTPSLPLWLLFHHGNYIL
jgi:hypothetical protein